MEVVSYSAQYDKDLASSYRMLCTHYCQLL